MKTWKLLVLPFVIFAILLLGAYIMYMILQPSAASYERHVEQVMQMEQTNQDSPISGIRTGVYRKVSSLGENEFECTDDGIYYLTCGDAFTITTEDGGRLTVSYIFYSDHGSNSMIMLCGRPDCTHGNLECNAIVSEAFGTGGITYFDGHMYFVMHINSVDLLQLWRMDLDGSNRELVTSCFSANNGEYAYASSPYIQNGVFGTGLTAVAEESMYGFTTDWYYTKLDGRIGKMRATKMGRSWNDGFSFLSGSLLDPDGRLDDNWHLYSWDPDTDTKELLMEIPETTLARYSQAYWGQEAGYVYLNGSILKVNYPNGDTEVLVETGLSGGYTVEFFPDCIAMLETGSRSEEDPAMMYFYSWEGEKLGEVEIGFNNDVGAMLFGGESKDRIMLRGSIYYSLPEYYIEKSDFGTGNIEIHKFEYPDLDEETYTAIFGEE